MAVNFTNGPNAQGSRQANNGYGAPPPPLNDDRDTPTVEGGKGQLGKDTDSSKFESKSNQEKQKNDKL